MGLEPSLSVDRCGIYLWTRRFVVQFYWALRFWEVRAQRVSRYNGGNFSFGPLYVAWYDRKATYPHYTSFAEICAYVQSQQTKKDSPE